MVHVRSSQESWVIRVGKPVRITVPCCGLAPGSTIKVSVFDVHTLGGDPLETFDARVSEAGDSAVATWTYDRDKHKGAVSSARLMLLVEAGGRFSASRPFDVIDTFEAVIKDPSGAPAAHRRVTLFGNRRENVEAVTDANGKVKVPVAPGAYHVGLGGPVPPEERIPDHDRPVDRDPPTRARLAPPAQAPIAAQPLVAAPAPEAPPTVEARLPIRLSFASLDEATAWLARNPVEVRVDGEPVETHATATAADRVVVAFAIPHGSHAVFVSSRSVVGSQRIVYCSRKVTVTVADSSTPAASPGAASSGPGPVAEATAPAAHDRIAGPEPSLAPATSANLAAVPSVKAPAVASGKLASFTAPTMDAPGPVAAPAELGRPGRPRS